MNRLALVSTLLAFGCSEPTNTNPPKEGVTMLSLSPSGHDRLVTAVYDQDGNLFAAGAWADSTDSKADHQMVVAKLKSDGTLDAAWGKMGYATVNVAVGTNGELARTIALQSSGKIVIAGAVDHVGATDARDRDIAAVRLNKDGTLDTSFGTGGKAIFDLSDGEVNGMSYTADTAWGLAVLSDDQLVIHGAKKRAGALDTDFALVKLSADGALDTSFGDQGVFSLDIRNASATPKTVTVLDGGALLGSGYMSDNGVTKPVLFKVTANGQLDTSFGTGGYFADAVLAAVTEIYAVGRQGDKLVTAGYGKADAMGTTDWVSLRFSSDGKLDTTYGTNGVAQIDAGGFNDNCRSVVVLPDNRVLLAGGGRNTETNVDAMVAILTPDGKPDTTFAAGGFKMVDLGGSADMWWGISLNPDKTHAVTVGVKGVAAMEMGNDDAAMQTIKLQ
jgi:uncharacterized delta-60 repeat protein